MKIINTSEKRFKLVKFRFETDTGGYIDRHMITDNLLPMFEVNQWIEMKSLRSSATGKEYASKLVVFLSNVFYECAVAYDSFRRLDNQANSIPINQAMDKIQHMPISGILIFDADVVEVIEKNN